MNKWMIIAVLLLVVGGVGMGITYKDAAANKTETVEQVFEAQSVSKINVETKNNAVYIEPSASDDIHVTFTGDMNEHKLEADIKGDTLHVKVKSNWKFNFISIDFFTHKNKLQIQLPEQLYDEITVNNSNGKIALHDIKSENVDVYTANGVIDVKNVTTNLIAKSENGVIRVSDLVGEADVRTSNGALKLANITGKITGETDNGAIKYEAATIEQDIDLQSDNGAIKVIITEKLDDLLLDLKTDVGTIRVNGEKDWQPKIGNGTHNVRLKTDVGSIKITDQ